MGAKAIDPGKMRHHATLQALATVPDGAGGYTEQWTTVAFLFARLALARAASLSGADQVIEETLWRVTVRHRADVAPGMRLLLAARILTIRTVVDPDETGRYLELTAAELRP